MQIKAISSNCASFEDVKQRRLYGIAIRPHAPDGGMTVMERERNGRHPKMKPGPGPLAAVPPGGRGTLPRREAEAVPYGGCCADP